MVGFTPLSASHPPAEVLGIISDIFGQFDELADKYGVHKVKTIGGGRTCRIVPPCTWPWTARGPPPACSPHPQRMPLVVHMRCCARAVAHGLLRQRYACAVAPLLRLCGVALGVLRRRCARGQVHPLRCVQIRRVVPCCRARWLCCARVCCLARWLCCARVLSHQTRTWRVLAPSPSPPSPRPSTRQRSVLSAPSTWRSRCSRCAWPARLVVRSMPRSPQVRGRPARAPNTLPAQPASMRSHRR